MAALADAPLQAVGAETLLIVLVSVLAATLPILAYLMFIWWLDRYEREPIWLVALTFLWGAIGAVVLSVAGSLLMGLSLSLVFGISGNTLADTVVIAPLVEEITKGVVIVVLFLSRDFDNTTDGIVYGAAVGLGFAMTENFLYFVGAYASSGVGGWASTVIVRSLFSGVMHCVASSLFGAALGYAKYPAKQSSRWLWPAGGLLAAMGVHAFWNGSLVIAGSSGSAIPAIVAFIGIPMLVAMLFGVMQMSMAQESKAIATELAEECSLGIIPERHLSILPYYFRRLGNTWLPPDVDRKRYIPLATTLAMRKYQRRRVAPEALAHYDEEITRLRAEIRKVLGR